MKLVRSALLFVISVVLFSACFNPPEFSNSPFIEYKGIWLGKTVHNEDSLVITLSFKDGNGDVGLNPTNPAHADSPYHDVNFFTNKAGQKSPLSATLVKNFSGYALGEGKKTPKEPSYFMRTPSKDSGPLIAFRDRDQGVSALPPYAESYKCAANSESYLNQNDTPDTIYIWKDDKHLIRDKTTKVDSLYRINNREEYFYADVDYFYMQPNPGQYDIYVKFFIKNNDGGYTEYDWAKEFCANYNGRIPILTDKQRPLEGIIDYSMVSSGFLVIFGNKTLRLEVTIYDRALNSSNTVVTNDFRLEDI